MILRASATLACTILLAEFSAASCSRCPTCVCVCVRERQKGRESERERNFLQLPEVGALYVRVCVRADGQKRRERERGIFCSLLHSVPCVCVFVCVRERETEHARERERERDLQSMLCLWMCERERERERESG